MKIPEEVVFLFFSSEFSRILSKNFFTFLAKKLQEVFKTTFYVSRGTVCGLNFFLKFWTVLGFLQNSLAWFSNFYLRVQIKYSERKIFFILLFIFFSDFERKIYQTFGQKTSRSFQNYPLRAQRNSLWLEFVFQIWTVLDFLQKPLAWSSKFYLGVQSKNCGRNNILIFFSEIFRTLSEKFFRLSAKKLQEVFKTSFYVSRGTVCGLNFFSKFWIVFDLLQKPLV